MSSERPGIGQRDVVQFFRRAVASDRLAHAYLFLGPPGVGKTEFARELTSFIFCLDRQEQPTRDDVLGACGTCRNCRRIQHENFPDLHWFSRQKGKRDIIMEDIDRFLQEMSLKPVEGPWKVFVIEAAHQLNVHSANHLLKVLEEPPAHSLIILLAEESDDLLPTILSRVHVIRFKGLPVDELAPRLVRDLRLSSDEARFLARLSGGSPGLARELHEQDFHAAHKKFLDRLRTMRPSENFDVAEEFRSAVEQMLSTADEEQEEGEDEGGEKEKPRDPKGQRRRELTCLFLDALMLALRDDLQRACASGSPEDVRRLESVLKTLLDAAEAVTANANVRLVLENMFFEVARSRPNTL